MFLYKKFLLSVVLLSVLPLLGMKPEPKGCFSIWMPLTAREACDKETMGKIIEIIAPNSLQNDPLERVALALQLALSAVGASLWLDGYLEQHPELHEDQDFSGRVIMKAALNAQKAEVASTGGTTVRGEELSTAHLLQLGWILGTSGAADWLGQYCKDTPNIYELIDEHIRDGDFKYSVKTAIKKARETDKMKVFTQTDAVNGDPINLVVIALKEGAYLWLAEYLERNPKLKEDKDFIGRAIVNAIGELGFCDDALRMAVQVKTPATAAWIEEFMKANPVTGEFAEKYIISMQPGYVWLENILRKPEVQAAIEAHKAKPQKFVISLVE